jgi:myo-inositol-1(or 4)-monophosphatase
MDISIDFLKEMASAVYDKVHPILGTEKAAEKQHRGAGGDIARYIDILAENTIIDSLENAKLDVLLISEEVGEKYIGNKDQAIKTQQKIIVDPVDGSNNAIRGIPYCSVSIAYAIGNSLDDILKGVIIDLSTKDIFWAEKDDGAYFNDKKICVSNRDITQNCFAELNFPLRHVLDEMKKFNLIIKKFHRIRVMGSTALSMCQLAKGSIDVFIDFVENSRLVDVAAGILIIKEAGGKIFSREGKELNEALSINTKFPFVASNAELESYLREKLVLINSK